MKKLGMFGRNAMTIVVYLFALGTIAFLVTTMFGCFNPDETIRFVGDLTYDGEIYEVTAAARPKNDDAEPTSTDKYRISITEDVVYDGDTIGSKRVGMVNIAVCDPCAFPSVYAGIPGVVEDGTGIYIETAIRINGIDTPEITGEQKPHGTIAKVYLQSLIRDADAVYIANLQEDKYYSRIVADVYVEIDGEVESVADNMIDGGYAVACDGGTKTHKWDPNATYPIENN